MSRDSSGRTVQRCAGLSVALGLTLTLCASVGAQTVFYACYTDKTGVIYLIDPTGKDPNLPAECAKPGRHIQFGWVDGKGAEHAGLTGLRADDHPQYLITDGSRPMTGDLIARTKVGIGVTKASAPLTLLPVDGADIEFASGTGDNADILARNTFHIGTLSNHPVSLLTQGQFRVYVAGDGKVGVGTYQPTELLTVAGTVESSTGGFKFPDGTVQTSAAASGAPAILADGVTSTTDGFAVTGGFGTGSVPATGAGTRLMWYPGKAAFRAGRVLVSNWDDAFVGDYSVAAGYDPTASGLASSAMGFRTVASGNGSLAAGWDSEATGDVSTALGSEVVASGNRSTAFGANTTASGASATALGQATIASGYASTASGFGTEASGEHATALGSGTQAIGRHATALGSSTKATGEQSVAMGRLSEASGQYSTALGASTFATGIAATALGGSTRATGRFSTAGGSGSIASGDFAIALGQGTVASGSFSTALGHAASTDGHLGSFVYGDGSTTSTVLATAQNQFMVRAAGGTIFHSSADLSSGVELTPGAGSWSMISDRNRKHLFRDLGGEDVLAKIAAMPIQSWSYRSQDASIRHVGPTAQDFFAAFRLGSSDLTITTSDISGINMLAIQALERRTRELADARTTLDELESRLAALEAVLNGQMTTTVNR